MTARRMVVAHRPIDRQDPRPRVRSPRPRDAGLTVSVVRRMDEARGLRREWAELHRRSGTSNPYTHPAWMLTWASTFLQPDDLYVMAVRRGPHLIGVAPLCWIRRGGAIAALHLMGNPVDAELTEVPGLLVAPGEHRTVFRHVLDHLQDEPARWDWVKLTLDATQGWFEPQWLRKTTRWSSPVFLHQSTRAFVIVDLPASWEAFLATRKRNVRQSIRRSTNRLATQLPDWRVDTVTSPALVPRALATVFDLHTSRTEMPGKPYHPSMLDGRTSRRFFVDAVTAMAGEGMAQVDLLCAGDATLAGLVVLRAGGCAFASLTGAAPEAWAFGPGTMLLADLFRREIARGTGSVNLSGGPNQSKLRWSEHIEYHHDFAVIGRRPRSKVAFGSYLLLRAVAELDQAMDWDVKRQHRRPAPSVAALPVLRPPT